MIYGGFRFYRGTPDDPKLDHFIVYSIETHGDLGDPHDLQKPPWLVTTKKIKMIAWWHFEYFFLVALFAVSRGKKPGQTSVICNHGFHARLGDEDHEMPKLPKYLNVTNLTKFRRPRRTTKGFFLCNFLNAKPQMTTLGWLEPENPSLRGSRWECIPMNSSISSLKDVW